MKSTYSGRLLLRMPTSLHGELARAALADRVSLNQFICTALAGAVSWTPRPSEAPAGSSEPGFDEQAGYDKDQAVWEMWGRLLNN